MKIADYLALAQKGLPEATRPRKVLVIGADGGDALLLQYLHVPLDATRIQLANPFAKELLAYVEQERARVGNHDDA